MFTYQMASMQDKVSVNVLHPGFVDTNIAGNEGNLIKYIVKCISIILIYIVIELN